MSGLFVRCTELGALPPSQGLQLADVKRFEVHLQRPSGDGALRQLSLRAETGDKSASDVLILACELVAGNEMEVRRVGNRPVILEEGDDARKLWVNDRVRPGTVLTLQLDRHPPVRFSLDLVEVPPTGLNAAVPSSDWRELPVRDRAAPARWRIPDLAATLEEPVAAAGAAWKKVATYFGKYKTAAWMILPYGAFGISGYYLYRQNAESLEEAEARNASLEAQVSQLGDALQASLASEASCRNENVDLAVELQSPTAQSRSRAARALALADTRSRASKVVGAVFSDPRVVSRDERAAAAAVDAIAQRLNEDPGLPPRTLDPCLEWTAALAQDLPTYVLTWGAYDVAVCPPGYALTVEGVPHSGRWGLSPRFLADFQPAVPSAVDAADADARMAWTLARGVREIRATVLGAATGGRPPVLPSQADLWALTLADAYNRLPQRADGAVDATAAECVTELMADLQTGPNPPEVGAPVLPDLLAVVKGDALATPSTLACPWAPDGWSASAERALRAVVRAATLPKASP